MKSKVSIGTSYEMWVRVAESLLAGALDLGRQTQIHGKKVPVHEMCAKIDAVTLEVSHHLPLRFLHDPRLILLEHIS